MIVKYERELINFDLVKNVYILEDKDCCNSIQFRFEYDTEITHEHERQFTFSNIEEAEAMFEIIYIGIKNNEILIDLDNHVKRYKLKCEFKNG